MNQSRLLSTTIVFGIISNSLFAQDDRAIVHGRPKPLNHSAVTSDWPTLLGPNHNNTTPETKLAKSFGKDGPPLIWEIAKGNGYSAPTVSDGRVVLFHRIWNEEIVQCLDAETGSEHWRFSFPTTYTDRYGFNNGPRATPVIHDGLVYVQGVEGWLYCLDLNDGAVRWKRQLRIDFDAPQNYFGIGTTPLVERDLLIVNVGGRNGPSVVAFNAKTGKTVWTTKADGDDGVDWGASYATPVPMIIHGQRRVLVFAGGDVRPPTGGLLVVNPLNGDIDFRFPFRSRKYESVNAASPVVVGDAVFLTTSYDTGGALVRPDDTAADPVVWKSDALRAHFATPILHEGHLYGFDGSGQGDTFVVCVDARTGKQVWKQAPSWEEVVGDKKDVSFVIARGSLVHADGRFLCLGEFGHLLWLDMTPKHFEILARVRLFLANETWTPPVISRGLLYVCQNHKGIADNSQPRLLCYDLRGESVSRRSPMPNF